MKALRSRLTYSNVMVTILAFVVLGGTAYAATELGKNSVGTKQLKNGAVTKSKISKSAQKALKGATGPKGDTGAKGQTGAKGDTGPKGSDASALLLARVNGVPQNSASNFGSPSGTSSSNTTIGNVQMLTPFTTAVKLDGFSITTSAPIGLNSCAIAGVCAEIVQVFVNGVASALTCVIPFGGVICTSGTATITVPAGAELAIGATQIVGSLGSFDMQVALHTSPT